jgi:hypothetical protein
MMSVDDTIEQALYNLKLGRKYLRQGARHLAVPLLELAEEQLQDAVDRSHNNGCPND